MTDALAALDRALAKVGSQITIQRVARAAPGGATAMVVEGEVTVRAFIQPISGGQRDSQVVDTIAQNGWLVIVSPTEIAAAGWESGSPVNPTVPTRGNRLVTNVGPLTVVAATPFYVADELVRIELQARG